MRTVLIALLIAACGGPAKPTAPPPQLPEDKKPEPVAEAPKPAPPPKDPDPIDVPLPYGVATYKLTTAGKGAKSAIKIVGTAGTKQQVAFNVDYGGTQTGSPQEGSASDVAPTLVINTDVEVGETTDKGSKFTLSFTGIDARDRAGSRTPTAAFKEQLLDLKGVSLAAMVAPNGQITDAQLHVPRPDQQTLAGLEIVKASLFAMWPILPTEPVGVGAKWTVTTPSTVVGTVAVDVVTSYEVVAHKGTAWTLKSTTKINGKDQKIGENQFDKISGSGSQDVTLDAAFIPHGVARLTNDFTVSKAGTSFTFHLEQQLATSDVGEATTAPPLPAGVAPPAPAGTSQQKSNVPVNQPAPATNQVPAGGSTPTPSAPKK
ncbi:MAG: DUF6263 family protein [Kofleriaceae bacterium]